MTKRSRKVRSAPAARGRESARVELGLGAVVGIIALAVVILGSWFLASEWRIAGEWGYALDDSWIYATMARNLATGHGFAFNPDEPVAGATGPLYTFFLGLFYLVFREVIWSAKIFGMLCQIGAGVCVYLAALTLLPGRRLLSLAAALLVVASPPLVWGMLSGMEIPLYLLLVSAGLVFYLRSQGVWAVALWSVGVWVRPDGLFLVALGLLAPPREAARRLAAAVPILLAFFAFNYMIGGHWMPQTVGVKAHFGLNLLGRTWNMMREWGALWGIPYRPTDAIEAPAIFLPLLLLGVVVTARRWPLLALYAIGFPLALSLFREHSASHKRYILYVVPFVALLSVAALDWLERRFPKRLPRGFAAAAAAICLAAQGLYLPAKAENHGLNVQNINGMHRFLGERFRNTTAPSDRIATNDIGAIAFFSDRYIVDTEGLVTPKRPLPELLTQYRPRLLAVFPYWYKEYAGVDSIANTLYFDDADGRFRYWGTYYVQLEKNTVAARDNMVVCERTPRGAPPPERLPGFLH